MAVLIEGLSVVMRYPSIAARYQGGEQVFMSDIPSRSWCHDGELVRVGFMAPESVQKYVERLEARGLQFKRDRRCVDIVVVDQRTGPTVPCNWIEFGFTHWNKDTRCPIAVCRAKPTHVDQVVVPLGWVFDGSLSANHRFVPTAHASESLEFLRREGGVDIYRDKKTGQELFVARPDLGKDSR